MLTIDRLCARTIRLIHTPIRVYDGEGRLVNVYVDNGELQDPVVCDPELLRLLLDQRRMDCPSLYLEGENVIYGILSKEDRTYILGPCCLDQEPIRTAKRLVRQHGMDSKRSYRIPCIALMDFCEIVLTLFECLTGITMDCSDLQRKNFCDQRFEQELHEKVLQVFLSLRENSVIHNPYSQELVEQESIRTGDLDGLFKSLQIPYVGKVGTLAREPLRQAKDLAIVNITLASRSAIQGGMLPEVAYSMSDAYIQRVEELDVEAEVYALFRQVEVEYCRAVANLSRTGPQNTLLTRCKDMIAQRLHTRIMIKDLASELNITSDYLAQLFLKGEGMKPTEYILQEKVISAKHQLAYSSRSYKEIANSLAFASQSHFGQAFKKFTGMTPKQYRETYSQNQTEDE